MAAVGQQQSQPQTIKKKNRLQKLFSTKDQNSYEEQQEIISENPPAQMHVGLADRTFRSPNDSIKLRPNGSQPINGQEYDSRGGLKSPNGQTINRKPLDGRGSGGDQGGLKNEEVLSGINEPLRSQIAALLESKDKWKSKYINLDADYEEMRKELLQVQKKLEDTKNDYKEADADVKIKNNELRQRNLQYEEEKMKQENWIKTEKELRQEIQRLESNLKTESEKQLQYYKQFQTEKSRADQLITHYQGFDSRFQETSRALETKTLELSKIEVYYQDLQKTHLAASDELARMKLESRSTLDDQFFLEYWRRLQREIQGWAETYFWCGAKKSNWMAARVEDQPIINQKLLELSPDCPNLLYKSEDGSGRALVAEAYVWKYIEERILDGDPKSFSQGFFWAHNLRGEVCRMEKFLRPREGCTDAELRMFYKWKSSTAKLLISRLQSPSERLRVPVDVDVFDYMINRILRVLDSSLMASDVDLASCRSSLRGILQSVIEFDAHINEQWSILYAVAIPREYHERYGFSFNSSDMESVHDIHFSEGEYVGLVVSPALVRRGTANGDQYDKIELIAKSRVLPQGFLSNTQKSKYSKTRMGQVMEGLYRK